MTNALQHFPTRAATRVGGWSLIGAAIGFVAVFGYLASQFNYPRVLDGTAADVLPALLTLGNAGRAVWVLYALLPLLLIPAALGAAAALGDLAPNAMRGAVVFGAIAALSMLLGLARWPSMHWELAKAYATAGADARIALDAIFRGLNAYLGNFVGEFLGELSLNTFFVLSGFALMKTERNRWVGRVGMAVGLIGLISAFRNVAAAVGPIADVNNYLLPLWLITFGIVLLRWRRPAAAIPVAR